MTTKVPKDTTSPKHLLLVFLVLFLYFTGQINGLIVAIGLVAIGLVAYFFYGKSDNREIPSIQKKRKKRKKVKKVKIVTYRCTWCCGCGGHETYPTYCHCEKVVTEYYDYEDDSETE